MSGSDFEDMHKLLLAFIARPESGPFREPVDWKNLGLLDYPQLVKHPMDLGTIKLRLESNSYSTIEEVAADIRLVWTNCMTYNQDGSEYYQLADTFAKKFEEKYAVIRHANSSSAEDVDRVPSLEEKTQLSYDIFKIDTTELGCILTIIEKSCPKAINRRDSEDEVLVCIDFLTPSCFHEVAKYVSACTSAPGSDANKTKKRMRAAGSDQGGSLSSNSASNIPLKKKVK